MRIDYVLTEKEWDDLNKRPSIYEHEAIKLTLEFARIEILRANDRNCIHNPETPPGNPRNLHYCDQCPVYTAMGGRSYANSNFKKIDLICTLSKDYSK